MIADKDEIIYSLKKSVNELENTINSSIKNNNTDVKDIYNKLGIALLWIGCCLDRLRENKVIYSSEEHNLEKAFRGAYDAQKHSISLVTFNHFRQGGITSPFHFPLVIPAPNYYFSKLDETVLEHKKEIKIYNKILSNKPIMLEVRNIEKIILSKLQCV